jgi:Spy/CpxP family protein refolding chaperone
MNPRKTIAVVLLALLILPVLAAAAPGRGGPGPEEILRNPRLLARYLKLTEAQAAQLRTFSAELKTSLEAIRTARRPLEQSFHTLITATSPNACAVGDAALALHANSEQAKAALETFDDKFSAILTPEQLARYEALKAAAHALGGDDE